jgi:hypothetical protein
MVGIADVVPRNTSAQKNPVAAIVPIGIDAAVGDVTVAGVVLTEESANGVSIDSSRHGIAMRMNLRLDTKIMAGFEIKAASSFNIFEYTPSGMAIRADSLLGTTFLEYSKIAEYSTVVGFCPKSEDELSRKLKVVAKNISHVIRDRYPDSIIYVSRKMFGFDLANMWELGSPTFPSERFETTGEAEDLISPTMHMRLVFAIVVAEAMAVGVRTARILDQSEMYPILSLDSNMGYSCSSLYRGLEKLNHLGDYAVRGLRGKLTSQWMNWAESNLVTRSSFSRRSSGARGTPGQITKDDQGRDAMVFDKILAEKLVQELADDIAADTPRAQKLKSKTKVFVQSVSDQLKTRGRLSDRQMYVLAKVHDGKMNW